MSVIFRGRTEEFFFFFEGEERLSLGGELADGRNALGDLVVVGGGGDLQVFETTANRW